MSQRPQPQFHQLGIPRAPIAFTIGALAATFEVSFQSFLHEAVDLAERLARIPLPKEDQKTLTAALPEYREKEPDDCRQARALDPFDPLARKLRDVSRAVRYDALPMLDVHFDHHAVFDPTGDFDAFLKTVPAKWVVYLVSDQADQPIQLLCVKNLRYSLKRRLGGEEEIGPTRRVNYREIVRNVKWTRVDSAFEADLAYFEAARVLFPQSYQGMVGFRTRMVCSRQPRHKFSTVCEDDRSADTHGAADRADRR